MLLKNETPFFYQKKCNHSLTIHEKKSVRHIENSIRKALKNQSKLDDAILHLPGYSSPKVRHFLNNLCEIPNAHYLEIGCWKGSTFISALYNNNVDAIAIDNWTEFGGPQMVFSLNCEQFLPSGRYRFYEIDCFAKETISFFKDLITIYFYDGSHTEFCHEKAFTHYNSVFNELFIAIVDDWNFDQVRCGTYKAFSQLHYKVLHEKYLPASFNGDKENWWNGLYVALIRKT